MCRHLKQGPAEGLGNYFCQDSTWIYFREHFAKFCWVLSLFHFQKHAKTSQKVVLGLLVLSAPGHAVWQRPRAAGELVSGKNKPHTVKTTLRDGICQFVWREAPTTADFQLPTCCRWRFRGEARSWLWPASATQYYYLEGRPFCLIVTGVALGTPFLPLRGFPEVVH